MCGIAGILALNDRPADERVVRRITRAIAHRGPDGEGVYVNGPVGLGHRRLAILDLSEAGRQPMSYGEGRYWITYNGEIYNFLELRHELEEHGYVFHTQSDTEVILAAYDRWGPDCQLKLNGMWAFAIWDSHERTLFLSRDRFGIKPLFYLHEPGRFVFGSEMKVFLHLDDFTPSENQSAIRRTLADAFSLEDTDETLLQGVNRLVAGHCMIVGTGAPKVWRWWSTIDHLVTPAKSFAGQVEEFRELFFDSCRLRLRSDVPVATCLSGGVDSSAVLCTLAQINASANGSADNRQATDWQRAFVATFPGTPLDERRYAEIAIRHAGAKPQYRPVSPDLVLEDLDQLIYSFEDIYITLPAPVWGIYRELRRDGVVVSLDGHGADEMLGGYQQYTEMALRTAGGLVQAPMRTLDMISTLYNLYAPDGPVPPPSRVRLAMNSLTSDPVVRFPLRVANSIHYRAISPLWPANGSASRKDQSAAESFWGLTPPPEDPPREFEEEAAVKALGPVNARLYQDFHHSILPTILRNFDRCSMAHGVEVRMPFMDWRLVSFVFSLPEESKIGGGFTKRVMREAMRGVMPEELRTRKGKIGFNSPLPDWFNGPLRGWVREQVNSGDFLQSGCWNGPKIRDFVERKLADGTWTWDEAQQVWLFLHTHVWQQTFCKRRAS